MILNATGWEGLAPGTLNLAVNDSVIDGLGGLEPKLEEAATGIAYPAPYEWIPTMRKAYWYYAATARFGGAAEPVLVRRAQVPVPGVVELFAAVSLTDKFNLKPDDVVRVEIHANRRATHETSA
jgi:CTP-dependent riboflavin kinase